MPNFKLVIWTIITGLAIAGLYLFVKRIVLHLMTSDRLKAQLLTSIGYVEKLFWPCFMLLIAASLILSHTIVGLAICIFIAGVLWKTLNDYFTGIIYLFGTTYKVGQRIRYEDQKGSIKSFNTLSLEMELEDGESMEIPYRYFADATIIRTSPLSGILSHAITIPIAKPSSLEKEKRRIKAMLLAQPWVLPSHKIVFEHISEEKDQYLIKVIVHGIDKNHMYKVENRIKSMYLEAG